MQWSRGWIPLVDDKNPQDPIQIHRPWPGFPGYTLCGRPVQDLDLLVLRKPAGVLACLLCQQFAGRKSLTADKPRPNPREQADLQDRRAARGGSVRALRGGLPGMGKRR